MPAFEKDLVECFLIDTHLVVRKVRQTRNQVRDHLGIPQEAKVVFINFGGMPMDSPTVFFIIV
jgi:hypothetical protein